MDALQQAYVTEAKDVLEALEQALLGLDEDPTNGELIDGAFRALHTLKGSGAMAGFSEVERFTHRLESAFDEVRSGQRPLDPALLTLTLESLDHLGQLVAAGPEAGPALAEASDQLLGRLRGGGPKKNRAKSGEPAPKPVPTGEIWGSKGWLIRLTPEPDLLEDGLDPLDTLRGLERLGGLLITGAALPAPPLAELEPGHLHLSWRALFIGEHDRDAIEEALFFLSDRAELLVEPLGTDVRHDAIDALSDELVEPLSRGDIGALAAVLTDTPVHGDLPSPKKAAPPAARAAAAPAEDMVKVSTAKLDVLVDLVGELVIAQARLADLAKRSGDPDFGSVAEDLERMCASLRDSAMGLRMLPIGATFTRYKRLVRDVAQQLDKQIRLETEGEETELDKTVIDKLGDPLVHLIRNALDHGLEPPDVRRDQGKNPTGTLYLGARHRDATVVIEVRDDGKGLDAQKIRKKAIERGIIDEKAELTEEELQELIFAPGFSTADQLSELSGRGVGMDAVKSAVKALRGEISVRSRLGEGTTVQISLPLTLAIIEGLLVRVGGSRYVLPLSQVEECVPLPAAGRKKFDGAAHHGGCEILEVRGEVVPYFNLGPWFGERAGPAEHQKLIITHQEGRRHGFVVDEVIGQQQTVIKSLGRAYRGLVGISGATILGDGDVALILDPAGLATALEHQERGRSAA